MEGKGAPRWCYGQPRPHRPSFTSNTLLKYRHDVTRFEIVNDNRRRHASGARQPFKDPGNAEATVWGWSPARSRKLGAAALTALAAMLDNLR
jgi:hypothetical protein